MRHPRPHEHAGTGDENTCRTIDFETVTPSTEYSSVAEVPLRNRRRMVPTFVRPPIPQIEDTPPWLEQQPEH